MQQRILVIKLGALGDVVIATSHIERIVAQHAGADISILTAPEYAGIFQAHPRLHVVAYPRTGCKAMVDVLRWMRRQGFDVLYDLQGSGRSRLFTRWSGVPVRVGLGPGYIYTHSVSSDDASSHIFDRLNRLLDVASIAPADPGAVIHIAAEDEHAVSGWLRDNALDDKTFILVHAGSSARWPSKRWEDRHYQKFASDLLTKGIQVVWTGSDADASLNKKLSATGGIDTSGRFSITQLAALAQHARLALTTDSGPMHVFSSAGIPVYALFGPTDWRRSYAPGQKGRILMHPVSCSPCFKGICPPEQAHRCMRDLTPEQVLGRLREDALI